MVAAPAEFSARFAALRIEFVRGLAARQREAAAALALLRSSPSDLEARAELRRAFHRLIGAGASFGFPELTRLGEAGEQVCDALQPAAVPEIDVLEDLLGKFAAQARDAAVAARLE